VAIDWATSSEINSDYFTVEKSTDGSTFTQIAKVFSNGNTSTPKNYQVKDNTPANGMNYYRLSQFDKDGRQTIFGIKSINSNAKLPSLNIYPNPLRGTEITVALVHGIATTLNVQLLGMDGKTVFKQSIAPQGNNLKIKLLTKPNCGIYLLKVDGYLPIKLLVE
jgi:hypothetical protein